VAARLNYYPNRVARGLKTRRSHTLALIVSDIRNPFFAEVTRGAEDAARAGGYDLVLCNSDLDPRKQMEYVASLLEKQVDGILMNSVADLSRKQQDQLAASGVPIVLLNRSAASKSFSTVYADNEGGGAMAAQYLLRLGHQNIAHLTGPRRHGSLTDRARGFLRVLKATNPPRKLTVLHGENSFLGGCALAHKLLAQQPEVSAIFAANDLMAFGAIRAMLELGRRIPEDISLIGFDNVELAGVVHPPLTTIHQPKYDMGRAAVETLLRLARNKDKPVREHLLLGVELIERESCRQRP
jgi:LacI family transcriptional regulator